MAPIGTVLAMHNAGLFREMQRQKQYADAPIGRDVDDLVATAEIREEVRANVRHGARG